MTIFWSIVIATGVASSTVESSDVLAAEWAFAFRGQVLRVDFSTDFKPYRDPPADLPEWAIRSMIAKEAQRVEVTADLRGLIWGNKHHFAAQYADSQYSTAVMDFVRVAGGHEELFPREVFFCGHGPGFQWHGIGSTAILVAHETTFDPAISAHVRFMEDIRDYCRSPRQAFLSRVIRRQSENTITVPIVEQIENDRTSITWTNSQGSLSGHLRMSNKADSPLFSGSWQVYWEDPRKLRGRFLSFEVIPVPAINLLLPQTADALPSTSRFNASSRSIEYRLSPERQTKSAVENGNKNAAKSDFDVVQSSESFSGASFLLYILSGVFVIASILFHFRRHSETTS